MKVIRSISTMQRQGAEWRRCGEAIGLVPTMGCLHDGHLSLIRRARKELGPKGRLVVSLYVNPAQFGPGEDGDRYPRSWQQDRSACEREGVDVLFAPNDAQMYPDGTDGGHSTYVVEESLGDSMEGASRPTHFRGVTTVVAKLFHIVTPHLAVFGSKDYQQAAIIRRMIRDLNMPVRLVVAPTHRETDGVAMSSRNAYLNPTQRKQAAVLWEAIRAARREVRQHDSLTAGVLRQRLLKLLGKQPDARVDYIAFFHPTTLRPVARVQSGDHMALAVAIGSTRLIDNGRL